MSLKYPLQNTPNLDECKIAAGSLIIACGDSANSLDVMEEHFDQVTLLVQFFVVTALRLEWDSSYATHPQCADGHWLIAMASIFCEHGYWPDNYSMPGW